VLQWFSSVSGAFLQVFQMHVSNILSVFIRILQVLNLDVAYVALAIHVCCKCILQYFNCFERMLQVFYLDVAYVAVPIHKCCKRML
jgi:hypothetical protein